MSQDLAFIGRVVSVHLDSGTILTGKVSNTDQECIILDCRGSIYVIYRNKISAILLNAEMSTKHVSESQIEHTLRPTTPPTPRAVSMPPLNQNSNRLDQLGNGGYDITEVMLDAIRRSELEEEFSANDIGSGNQYGSILPADMLIEDEEADKYNVDLSVSMASLQNPGRSYSKDDDDSAK